MRIAIEAQRIFRPDKHGMDYAALGLIKALDKLDDDNEYYVIVAPGKDNLCLEESLKLSIIELKCPTYPLWEQVALPLTVKHLKVDLLHCTSNTAPLRCPVPLVLTLHDVIYMNDSNTHGMTYYQRMGRKYRRLVVPKLINRCNKIVTVSENEEEEIANCFPTLNKDVSVIYNGYNTDYHPIKNYYQITRKYTREPSYLLFLGNTDPRKNLTGVLHSYARYLQKSTRKQKLLITGMKEDYIHSVLVAENLIELKSHLVLTNYIPGNDLAALFNGAFALLFPSLLEGFGIPILEAMACGTPVITSNVSSMPEVAGKSELLVDPTKPDEIADAILRLEDEQSFYENQVAYGLHRVKAFSWDNTAQEYRNIYQEVYDEIY